MMRDLINIIESQQVDYSDNAKVFLDYFEQHPQLGINLQLSHNDSDTVAIQWIERQRGQRRGVGAAALFAMCEKADELCVYLVLGVEQKGRERWKRLVGYYNRFGFDETEDDSEFLNMSREPQCEDDDDA